MGLSHNMWHCDHNSSCFQKTLTSCALCLNDLRWLCFVFCLYDVYKLRLGCVAGTAYRSQQRKLVRECMLVLCPAGDQQSIASQPKTSNFWIKKYQKRQQCTGYNSHFETPQGKQAKHEAHLRQDSRDSWSLSQDSQDSLEASRPGLPRGLSSAVLTREAEIPHG